MRALCTVSQFVQRAVLNRVRALRIESAAFQKILKDRQGVLMNPFRLWCRSEHMMRSTEVDPSSVMGHFRRSSVAATSE